MCLVSTNNKRNVYEEHRKCYRQVISEQFTGGTISLTISDLSFPPFFTRNENPSRLPSSGRTEEDVIYLLGSRKIGRSIRKKKWSN